tara:strand:+ start:78 stop:812 length:735 start_codon:yes stop_codon:yes gene_type:complete
VKLYNGDCLEVMKLIPDKSIDAIITDPPYGTTACKWDSVIPFEPMWKQLNRIIKENGAIVLFGSEPFSSHLRISNIKNFKYDWIWDKKMCTGNVLAKRQPMRAYENVIVFYKTQCKYNRQLTDKKKSDIRRNDIKMKVNGEYLKTKQKTRHQGRTIPVDKTNPINVLRINGMARQKTLHPTQKPVALMEYLIKTYTDELETVLDFTMGSGTTGVACCNLNRNFIGIELDKDYFKIAEQRIKNEL